jgi:hypothetical protein
VSGDEGLRAAAAAAAAVERKVLLLLGCRATRRTQRMTRHMGCMQCSSLGMASAGER